VAVNLRATSKKRLKNWSTSKRQVLFRLSPKRMHLSSTLISSKPHYPKQSALLNFSPKLKRWSNRSVNFGANSRSLEMSSLSKKKSSRNFARRWRISKAVRPMCASKPIRFRLRSMQSKKRLMNVLPRRIK